MQATPSGYSKREGFTLIELLIVVAIIAILAAIAVPNFLEAQVRSKVSRAKSDMRSLGVALDSYFTDNNSYPKDHDNAAWNGAYRWTPWSGDRGQEQVGWFYLTTPVAYITSLPSDPFSPERPGVEGAGDFKFSPHYILASGSDNDSFGLNKVSAYMVISFGPDKKDQSGDEDYWPSNGQAIGLGHYDPTNGSRSDGDLYRFGGGYTTGDWQLWGIRWDQWGVTTSLP
ncbi:MAG TPA: prepilin-type N-terminal cleavage/methylation domain-containing protein [Sumerlaeia bacterium]|nr:prepilin-type N-terminal cleavage/methylation domain-containing protein [Sumerlaeia bacterium]